MKGDQFINDWTTYKPNDRSLINGYSRYKVFRDGTISLRVRDKEFDTIEEKMFFRVNSVLGEIYG